MAFGPIMRMEVPKEESEPIQIELAPLSEEVMGEFIKDGGLQSYRVTRYMLHRAATTTYDELEWFEKIRSDKTSVHWGIWVISGDQRKLIGSTGLAKIEHGPTGMKQATSGVLIFDRDFWGQGIASTIHKARTWFAFTELGLTRIKSHVIHGNEASKRALQKSGYVVVSTERNTSFAGGRLRHQDTLECLNPLPYFWKMWWGSDRPTKLAIAGRQAATAALAWAELNVTLP